MKLRNIALAIGAALLTVASTGAEAQSRQKFSLQLSLANVTLDTEGFDGWQGIGLEAQGRYTAGRWSVGAGVQSISMDFDIGTANFQSLFVEPRYVFWAGERAATYAAGRVGQIKIKSIELDNGDTAEGGDGEVAIGGGLGLLYKFGERVSGDLGAQVLTVDGGNFSTVRFGLAIGF